MRVRVASAGTGKTTSLVRRYLELVGDGVPLRRVAGVTFTRAAAAELRARVADGLAEVLAAGSYLGGLYTPPDGLAPFEAAARELGGAQVKTIHGFMVSALRLSAPLLGYDPRFEMVAEQDAAADFVAELDSLRLLAADPAHPLHAATRAAGGHVVTLPLQVFERRSLAAELVFADDPVSRAVEVLYRAAYARLLERYAGRRLGPSEVEQAAIRLLDHAVARDRLVRRFPVVLVDEYQDVNPRQGEFFERLEAAGARVEVVGDPKQSIYLFRNADVNVFRRAHARAREAGQVMEPLTESRRHSRAVVTFLNRLSTHLGAQGMGFELAEAPPVRGAGPQAGVAGSVEVCVVTGELDMDELRPHEAEALAGRLLAFAEKGVPFARMAVLARNRRQLAAAQATLGANGVPTVFSRRGLFTRQEVVDVRNALEVGAGPSRESLAAFLRGPLVGLGWPELRAVLASDDPLAALPGVSPHAAAVVAELRDLVHGPPVEALKAVVRRGLAGDQPLIERLGAHERANVDALLFEVARREPEDLTRLLDLMEELERTEAEDVPASGSGVRLITVHGSKGLEFDVVALYDAGYSPYERAPGVVVDPETGRVALLEAVPDRAAADAWQARSAQEDHRLLYVAVSRARDHLLVTGSAGRRGPAGWLRTLLDLGLSSDASETGASVTEVRVATPGRRWPARRQAAPTAHAPAPWTLRTFEHHPHGPLSSPSRLVDMLQRAGGRVGGAHGAAEPGSRGPGATGRVAREPGEVDDCEPLTPAEVAGSGGALAPAGAEPWEDASPPLYLDLPGRGRVVGTLVHFAISQDWEPGERSLESLRAHEVMFPYAPHEQDDVLSEVEELLAGYRELLGGALPPLGSRAVDRAELPLAYPGGPTVWEGVIDRLYRVGDDWWIDDYKTDRHVRPERYHVQLGLYRHAVRLALGVEPRTRLVFLRSRRVVELEPDVLDDALRVSGVLG